jgi:chemotaxis family two-component system response regulator PixG
MTSPEPKPDELQGCLARYRHQQFTGKVSVTAPPQEDDRERQWSLYFCLGRPFWVEDHQASNRRLSAHLSTCCPQLKQRRFALRASDSFECQNYNLLFILLQRKAITQEQFCQLVESVLAELWFDVFQRGAGRSLTFAETPYDPLDILKIASLPVNGDRALAQAERDWLQWQEAGLADLMAGDALEIADAAQLEAKVGAGVYQKLAAAIDGKRTVRELATLMNKPAAAILKSLAPYVRRGILSLSSVADLPDLVVLSTSAAPRETSAPGDRRQRPPNGPIATIACIDDSPQVCALMEELLTTAGYRPLCIQDSTRALTALLEHKPSLVFLDLIMPVANGYEICAQIRRIATFKDMPIVILTGNDGIIDRVRARVVGATDFIGKPVEADKIRAVLDKYLVAEAASPLVARSTGAQGMAPQGP